MEDKEAQNILELPLHMRPAAPKRLTKSRAKFINAEIFYYHCKIMKLKIPVFCELSVDAFQLFP